MSIQDSNFERSRPRWASPELSVKSIFKFKLSVSRGVTSHRVQPTSITNTVTSIPPAWLFSPLFWKLFWKTNPKNNSFQKKFSEISSNRTNPVHACCHDAGKLTGLVTKLEKGMWWICWQVIYLMPLHLSDPSHTRHLPFLLSIPYPPPPSTGYNYSLWWQAKLHP